MVAKFAAENPA